VNKRPLLTPAGSAVLVTGALLYAAGVLLGFDGLVVIGAAAAVALACGLLAVVVRPRLSVDRTVTPSRVTVGRPASGRLVVRNLSRWPAPSFVAVDSVGEQTIELAVRSLSGGTRRAVEYDVPTHRRGRLALGPITVERRDPLGLVRRAQPQGGAGWLWVRPRTHVIAALPVGVLLDDEGVLVQTAPRGSVTFSSLREYVPGDDPRQVHWRSTARTGTLMVKEHVDTSRPVTTVVLDARADRFTTESFEHAVEVAASVVLATQRRNRPVELRVLGEDIAAAQRLGARDLLDRLACADLVGQVSPAGVLELVDRATSGGALVLVTGRGDEQLAARVASARRRFTPVVLVELMPGSRLSTARRAGLSVVRAGTAAEAAGAWNQLVIGRQAR
jgi:uncharacterized protein (DUF58 family)